MRLAYTHSCQCCGVNAQCWGAPCMIYRRRLESLWGFPCAVKVILQNPNQWYNLIVNSWYSELQRDERIILQRPNQWYNLIVNPWYSELQRLNQWFNLIVGPWYSEPLVQWAPGMRGRCDSSWANNSRGCKIMKRQTTVETTQRDCWISKCQILLYEIKETSPS